MGRPTMRTPELIEAICARLETGEPMVWICRDEGMPNTATVWKWEQEDDAVKQAIARARELGGDAIAADALAIADETLHDTVVRPDGSETANSEWIARSRLRVETRLKLLAKWHPKRYGDKVGLVGADGEGPVQHAVAVSFVTPDKPV